MNNLDKAKFLKWIKSWSGINRELNEVIKQVGSGKFDAEPMEHEKAYWAREGLIKKQQEEIEEWKRFYDHLAKSKQRLVEQIQKGEQIHFATLDAEPEWTDMSGTTDVTKGRLTDEQREVLQNTIADLEKGDWPAQETARWLLCKWGPDAIPKLMEEVSLWKEKEFQACSKHHEFIDEIEQLETQLNQTVGMLKETIETEFDTQGCYCFRCGRTRKVKQFLASLNQETEDKP